MKQPQIKIKCISHEMNNTFENLVNDFLKTEPVIIDGSIQINMTETINKFNCLYYDRKEYNTFAVSQELARQQVLNESEESPSQPKLEIVSNKKAREKNEL